MHHRTPACLHSRILRGAQEEASEVRGSAREGRADQGNSGGIEMYLPRKIFRLNSKIELVGRQPVIRIDILVFGQTVIDASADIPLQDLRDILAQAGEA